VVRMVTTMVAMASNDGGSGGDGESNGGNGDRDEEGDGKGNGNVRRVGCQEGTNTAGKVTLRGRRPLDG
jgi:hypothetical protein